MTRLVAIIAYWTGLDALFYWLNRKKKRIITFHNILPKELWMDGVANGVSTKLEDFVKVVEMVRARFEITNDLFKPGTCTITFDDGYRNQYEYGYKTLKQMGVPAYFFISGDLMNGGDALIVDKLTHWVDVAPEELIPGYDRSKYWDDVIWEKFLADDASRGRNVLFELDAQYAYSKVLAIFSEEYVKMRLTGMSTEELCEIRSCTDYCVGWHTKSHYPLAKLNEDAVYEELKSPEMFLSNCLSYPYGNPGEVGEVAIRVAEDIGYPCAVANTNMASHGRYFLPRMALSAEKYLLHFELSGCKYFLKSHRLLPIVRCNNDLD